MQPTGRHPSSEPKGRPTMVGGKTTGLEGTEPAQAAGHNRLGALIASSLNIFPMSFDHLQQLAAYPLAGVCGHHSFSYLFGFGETVSFNVEISQCIEIVHVGRFHIQGVL